MMRSWRRRWRSSRVGEAEKLTEAWQLLCMNQFHDILTGTSIGQVFEDAKKDYARIDEIAGSVLQAAGRRADARGGGVAGA
jgi:alpha-mannosidase